MSNDDFGDYTQGNFADDYPQTVPDELPDIEEAGGSGVIQIKVSDDRGATWYRYELDVTVDLEDSGLRAGQLVNMNGEKYEVTSSEYGDISLRPFKASKKAGKRK